MEQSLQSTIIERLKQLKEARPDPEASSSSSCDDTRNKQVKQPVSPVPVKLRRSRHRARPVSMPSHSLVCQYDQKHSIRTRPPVDITLDDNCPNESDYNRSRFANYMVSPNKSKRGRNFSSKDTTTLDIETAENYLTLNQLKDLGLSLRQDHSSKNSGNLSHVSMQCLPSTRVNCLARHRQCSKRRGKNNQKILGKRAENCIRENMDEAKNEAQHPDVDSGRDSPAACTSKPIKDIEVNTFEVSSKLIPDCLVKSHMDDSHSELCYKVMHLHQHNHHYFHHFINHSSESVHHTPH